MVNKWKYILTLARGVENKSKLVSEREKKQQR